MRRKVGDNWGDEHVATPRTAQRARTVPDARGLSRAEALFLLSAFIIADSVTEFGPTARVSPQADRDARKIFEMRRALGGGATTGFDGPRKLLSTWWEPVVIWTVAVVIFIAVLGVVEKAL